jgi:putative iron-only hydrogenase system regulator
MFRLPDREVFPSGKACIRHESRFFAVLLPFRATLRKGSFRFVERKADMTEKRIGIVGIVIEDFACTERVNAVLHEYAGLIVGRMGIPYRERGVSVISLIVDGSNDDLSAMTGKLGRVSGASVKSMITKDVHPSLQQD